MTFNSVEFALLAAATVGLHQVVPGRWKNLLLLVASYVFYGWWDWRFLGLLWTSTVVDYVVARAVHAARTDRERRALLAVSLVVNLGILGTFKYLGFFVDSATELLASFGLGVNAPLLNVVLPVGISFYTFQTMSYTIDVFRGHAAPTRRFDDFALFVAYLPQLVAGPIERAQHLLPQIQARRPAVDRATLASGLELVLLGLFKKVVIADGLAPLVDDAFSNAAFGGPTLVGMYAFALQIYGDFSGYTDIARGTSRMFGIELRRNFDAPYLSSNITDFWRRWHMSLSDWLRDYLYIPLGGNQRGTTRTHLNLMLVMVLGGLWHGASWTFVVWGFIHGAALIVHRAWSRRAGAVARHGSSIRRMLATALTFHVAVLAFVVFRSPTLAGAAEYLDAMLTSGLATVTVPDLAMVATAAGAVLAIDVAQVRTGRHNVIRFGAPSVRGGVVALLAVAILVFSGGDPSPFIYFQF